MAVVSKQVNMELAKIKQKCPLYEANGQAVSLILFHEPFRKKQYLQCICHQAIGLAGDSFQEEGDGVMKVCVHFQAVQ